MRKASRINRINPAGGFEDLVPWADPYIIALIEKLRRDLRTDGFNDEAQLLGEVDELPPPLDSDAPLDDNSWQGDWSPRNWPGE